MSGRIASARPTTGLVVRDSGGLHLFRQWLVFAAAACDRGRLIFGGSDRAPRG
jgi:hypothetical protein